MRPYLRASMWRPTSRASMNCAIRSVSIAERKVGGRGVDDRLAVDDAGIVDQHVDAAVLADEARDLLAHAVLVGDVERHDLGLAASCA